MNKEKWAKRINRALCKADPLFIDDTLDERSDEYQLALEDRGSIKRRYNALKYGPSFGEAYFRSRNEFIEEILEEMLYERGQENMDLEND